MNDTSEQQISDYERLSREIIRLAPQSGTFFTEVPGLELIRKDNTDRVENALCRSCICFPVHGGRQAVIGTEPYRYGRGQLLLNCVEMPEVSQVEVADAPFLSVSVALDVNLLARIFEELDEAGEQKLSVMPAEQEESSADPDAGLLGTERSVRIGEASPELLSAFLRLVQIAQYPGHAHFVAPLILREIHYYLAAGPMGGYLRTFFSASSQSRRIVWAADYMREHCGDRLRIEDLARMVSMAESTFNRNFKKVTSLSPLQYHKQLKLHEARRLMLAESMSSAASCFAVGYESQQQFTREYKRLFGSPPMKDVRRNS